MSNEEEKVCGAARDLATDSAADKPDGVVEVNLDEIEGLETAVSLGGVGFGCGCGGIFGAFCG